jgi:hypothetical protein
MTKPHGITGEKIGSDGTWLNAVVARGTGGVAREHFQGNVILAGEGVT